MLGVCSSLDLTAVSVTNPPPDEGAIQFAYALAHTADLLLPTATFGQLRAWRQICKRLGLIGRDPRRYGGLGFGNVSVRDPEDPRCFVISASQTGGARDLRPQDLVRIRECRLERFWVEAEGRKPPSSETLTHAMIYAADPAIHWVLHVHAPAIWQRTLALDLPATPASVPYGSHSMAEAVHAVCRAHPQRPLLFATLGHEDGIFACGPDGRSTGLALIDSLAAALT
jgi:L-ribulose-5-phosphate 4-epimerase